jgi:hypothetical protein
MNGDRRHVRNPDPGGVPSPRTEAIVNALELELYNCGYNFPTVSNNPLTPIKTSFDVKPSSQNGTITGQILANDAILCGGIASTQWRVTVMKDQQTALQPTHSFVATFTLSARNMSQE